MKNNKTTIGGLLSSIGKGLTGAGVLTQLTQLLPASNVIPPSILVAVWWVTLVGVLLGVVGTTLTAYFAADASTVNNIASAVDKINALGSDPGQPPSVQTISKPQPPAPPAQP
jgi:hypothetical protein